MEIFIQVVGWLGALLSVSAFGLLNAGKVTATSRLYIAMNIVGAIFLIVNTVALGAWPSAALNSVWLVVAVGGLIRAQLLASGRLAGKTTGGHPDASDIRGADRAN